MVWVPAAGLVIKRETADAVIYHWPAWLPWVLWPGAAVLFVAAAVVAVRFRKTPSRSAGWAGGVFIAAGGLTLTLLALAMPNDRVEVRADGFTWSRGTGRYDVRFAEVARVELVKETFRGRWGVRNELNTLKWHLRDGRPAVVVPLEGPSMDARFDLIAKADTAGVEGAKGLLWRITTLH
jgi:membrane protein implicated in regulation of membrane protease activity